MPDSGKAASSVKWWVRSAVNGQEFGPASQAGLLAWAREGRIFPDDGLSNDRKTWRSAREWTMLEMDTLVILPDGRVIGPLHADAVAELSRTGKIPAAARIVTVQELLAEPVPAGEPGGMTPEDLETAINDRLESERERVRDALAEKDREIERLNGEVESAQHQADALRADVAKALAARAAAESLATRAREEAQQEQAEQVRALEDERQQLQTLLTQTEAKLGETATLRADCERAQAEAVQLRIDLEAARAKTALDAATIAAGQEALEKAQAQLAEAQAAREAAEQGAPAAEPLISPEELDALRTGLDEARTLNSLQEKALAEARTQAAAAADLRDALDAARTALAEAQQAVADSTAQLDTLRAERDAALAQAAATPLPQAAEAAAAPETAEAAAASAALQTQVEALTRERDALAAQVETLSHEMKFHAGDLAANDELVASLRKELEGARREYAELLEFSNNRDSQNSVQSGRLEARIKELEDAAKEPVLASDLHGDARQVLVLQERVTDLTRERCELADKLATAEAALAMATRPLEGDIAVIKQFADEALLTLRDMAEQEKKRADAVHAASVEQQNLLSEKISLLERALKRDPGEKSRSEMVAERNEKVIAQLRQELESQREQHKADLGRAAQTEKVLEGRVRSLQQRENALREQLRRVEQRTADYDSLGTQLRRREEEVLEAERQFGEAREQWQVVEAMLRRRISELEHGAGSLFEEAEARASAAADGARADGSAAPAAAVPAPKTPAAKPTPPVKQRILPPWVSNLR